ncbi:hypothetical protein [Parapedobacter soli]|uniref:hypothetical protein n=1 Tax=Parapedobacter soli TaxID=416955 RepID=UPI0021C61120|nr:hypothetical protein [Parapedobacter soli]
MTPNVIDDKRANTINKYPLAVLVMIVTALLTTFINKLFSTSDDRSADCIEQVMYLRERVTKLERQVDSYTTTIMALRGANTKLADSLAQKGGK